MISRIALASLGALALAGCGDNSADEAAAPEPVLTPNPTPTAAADGGALTPGSWQIGEDASGAVAAFGEADSEPLLTIACNNATGALTMRRAGTAAGAYTVDAGGTAAKVDMAAAEDALPMVEAAIDPGAPVFAAATDPAATLSITSPAGDTIRVPGAPGLRRVIEACS